jgi:single-stranded-DNA-specific exonuclease
VTAVAKIAPHGRPFLDVARSLTGKVWRVREADDALAEAHRRQSNLPEIAARLLAARGVALEDANKFLAPTLRDFFPDPSTFQDMDLAGRVIDEAIAADRPCAVFADYDVDGGTAAALLVRYFRARGRRLRIYVPDRMSEGYGPSVHAFERLKAEGVELVITVDCGAAAHGPIEAAAALGLDVVVIDHHLMHGPPPPARAVVNPNRLDDRSGQGHLTAAGVVLVLLAALNREARRKGSIGANNLPDLMAWLDLSALGTVCDVAPLSGFNRAVVAQGLKVLARQENPGIRALAAAAKREKLGAVYDLGFILGPRLNAGGRVGDSSLAARLLSTDDAAEAVELAEQLDALNTERRRFESEMLALAAAEAEAQALGQPIAIVGRREWHPGVIGIAAGRLKDRLMKPAIVLGGEGDLAKGSGRSVHGVNLGAAIAEAAKAGVLVAGGGHAMAAGLTLEWTRVDEFRAFMAEALAKPMAAAESEARTLWIDAVAGVAAIDLPLLDAIERIGPYGQGHPEPVFALADVGISYASAVKGDHVRCVLQSAGGRKIRAIAFRAGANALGEALMKRDSALHVAVKVKRDTYGGAERAEVEILDGAQA